MRVIKHMCDRCGTEIRGEVAEVRYQDYSVSITGVLCLANHSMELCADCNLAVLDFLNVDVEDNIRMKLESGEVPPVITFES